MESIEVESSRDSGVAARFGILKQRLMLRRLNETPEFEAHALIMKQADEAAFLAWRRPIRCLPFPVCLKNGPRR